MAEVPAFMRAQCYRSLRLALDTMGLQDTPILTEWEVPPKARGSVVGDTHDYAIAAKVGECHVMIGCWARTGRYCCLVYGPKGHPYMNGEGSLALTTNAIKGALQNVYRS